MLSSPRLIPEWKDLKLLINMILNDIKVNEKLKNNLVILSDWPKTLYQEPHHPKNKPFICFYSIDVNYFVSLNWVEPYSKQMQAILWIQKKDTDVEGMIEKMNFHIMDQVPPIQAMVHTGSYHMLIAYCGDMCLWLFEDHHRTFTCLGTVPCRFSISCLCYDSKTELLLSGTLGAVVTWFILPNGRDLQMAQTVPMPGCEFVQGFSLNGPQGSLLVLCENKVRVFTHHGQGQLKEVKKFTPITSGSSITCSFTCVSLGYFYAGNRDGEIHSWGLDRGNFLHSFQAHSSPVICIYGRPEVHTLLTAGSEGIVKEWNLAFGDLLRQLDIDEDLQQLQFINNTTFFCQTTHNFSLHSLPYFYSLFNVCGSALQQVQRVCCGHNWTRILCATKDGLLRFLSPVTGDLLLITWPLPVVDKAVIWAYDPDREELFVATDSSEVLVFDATRSPCTAKYLLCTSLNRGDRVKCLAYGQSHLGKGLVGLMFCGHESGIVRILSHYSCARIEKTIHSGAILALSTLEGPQEKSLLCSYGMDNILQLTEAVLQEDKVILQLVNKILCNCPLKHVILLPGFVGAITENHRWCLWHYQDFMTSLESKQSSMFKGTKCLHQCAITSFDVCLSLKLFVTGGIDGSVRIWDFRGTLITELDSALHFGPLCFANNRGDLLLTFNQSLYLVSCLKLLPPAQLIHLAFLNNADEIQEIPKPFLPSFFFSFEIVFVPKFVYLGQGLQELQGLEALVNKRVIAFDNSVPHVVEEERHRSSETHKESKLHFLEDKDIDFSTLDPKLRHTPHSIPAQLRLAGWDGLNFYHILRCFFGQGQPWPFAPDGYIPNSVVRACLWPEGTPIFLLYDLYPRYRDRNRDETELIRYQALSPMAPVKEKISKRKQDKSKWKQTLFDVLRSTTNLNWIGRKFDEGFINNLIEAILNLTVYCSVEQYKTYISVLAQIFATHQVSSTLYSETACRLLEDTTHSSSQFRELAWEGLERLGFMSPLFAIPLAMGLMDSDENVRAKALYLMRRVTGIQTKSMLVNLLKKRETFQDMQQEFIGKASLDQLLGIQAKDIKYLLSLVKKQLHENLTLSFRDQQFTFPFDISKTGQLEALAEKTLIPLSELKNITKLGKRMTHIQAKSRNLIKKDLSVSRKQKQTEFVKLDSVSVSSEDEGEQREARISEQIDIQDDAIEPELSPRIFSPVKSQEDARSKEIMLGATEAMEATYITQAVEETEVVEATEFMKATDQHGVKDYEEVILKQKIQEHMKRLWKRALIKSQKKADMKLKEKIDLLDISKKTTEEPKVKVIKITDQENDIVKKPEKSGRGLAGTPGRICRPETRCWRDDICSLDSSRIASSYPEMAMDLGQELVDLAQVMLAPQQPSWDIFQEICPLLKGSSESYHKVVEEQPILTENVVKEAVKEEGITRLREQGGKKLLKGKAFSRVKKKKITFFQDNLVLEKRKFKKEVKKLASQEGKIAEEERKRNKPEKKLIQEKEELTKDKKKLTHQKEEIAWEEEILASSQKKLSGGEQKLVLGEKKWTGKEEELLKERKRITQKEGKAKPGRRKWDWEESLLAQEEGIWIQEEGLPVWEERKLSQEEEEAGEEEEELKKGEEELDEKEKPGEGEELELVKEEEESVFDDEALIPDIQKQVEGRKKKPCRKKHIMGMEKHVEEEAWKRGKLAQKEKQCSRKEEGFYGEEGKWTLKRGSLAEQEIKLTQGKKKWLVKEKKKAHKKKQIQEKVKQIGKQGEEDQKERQAKIDEKVAKEKQLAWNRRKRGLEKGKFGEMEILSQEDKQILKRVKKTGEKEKKAQIEEKTTKKKRQQSWGAKKVGLGEEEQAEEMKNWSQEEKQAWGGKMQDQKEEELVGKDKTTEGKKQWTCEKGQVALQKEKQAQKERIRSQKKKCSDQKEQWAWEKEKLSLEEEEQADEMEKKFQENEGRALDKKLTKKDSILAKEERHISKKEQEIARDGTGITKRKMVQEGKEIMKIESKLSQEVRQLAYDKTTDMGVANRKKERTKEERVQAIRKLDIKRGISSEEKEISLRKKESHLLKILAKIIKGNSIMSLEEIKRPEEERPFIDGQRWEIQKEQEEITKEEKELDQKERKVDDDRLAMEERTLTDKESLEEDKILLEKVQETIQLDKTQAESMLKEIQEQNLLGKRQLKKLLKRIEKKPEKIQVKWLLENVRDALFESLSEMLTEKETEEGPTKKGKDEERLSKEEESLSEESLNEEEEESPREEKESPIKEEESLSEESLNEEEEESWREEEKESLIKEEERLREDAESSSEKEGKEEMEKSKKKEEGEKEERQKDEKLSKEKEMESTLKEAILLEEEKSLKTKLSKAEVISKLVKEGEILSEERESTARKEVPFKKAKLLDGRKDSTFGDKPIWPTVPKSPFKIPFTVALGGKKGMPLKILEDHLDLEGQESQLGAHPMTSSLGRQEDVLLEKARGILRVMEISLETQIPEGLYRPRSHLPHIIKPQKPEHRPKGGKWKWFLKYQDSSMGKTEGQTPAPTQVPAPAPAPSFSSVPCYLEASFSDEDWVNNALIKLNAGEQLSRGSFHRLSQLLRDFTSKGDLKWMHLFNLKVIAKHLKQNLEVSHTDVSQPNKGVLSPLHLKVIPPIRRKEKKPFPSPEPVLPSASRRTQTLQALNWHLLVESHKNKQAQQLSTNVKEIKHIYPIRKDEKSLDSIFQKGFQALKGRSEHPKFHKAKKEPQPIFAPVLSSTTKRIQVPTAINWHLLGEPYRSTWVKQISCALKEMETQHFYPATRDIFTGVYASVDKQTLALMFQKDLRTFKSKDRLLKLSQLETAKPNSKKKEEVPLWETFVALYHVLQMLQEQYAEDSATWMEQFYQLMDLYQLKSPRIQRLLLELLQRKEFQPQETIYKKALKTKELVLGERLLYAHFCGSSHAPAGPLKFQGVISLPGQNRVHTTQSVGIARYGFLELAWKNLPQVNSYLIEGLPNIPTSDRA